MTKKTMLAPISEVPATQQYTTRPGLLMQSTEPGVVTAIQGEELNALSKACGEFQIRSDPEFCFWVWPKDDYWVWLHSMRAFYSLETKLFMLKRKGLVVQCGGCVGYLPGRLSALYRNVLTFEPARENFRYLDVNCWQPNITKHCIALGAIDNERFGLERIAMNCGVTKLVPGDEVKSMTLDSFDLQACDAIILDAEASEPAIIKGALRTIERCEPELIVCETVSDEMITDLGKLGYQRGWDYGGDASFARP